MALKILSRFSANNLLFGKACPIFRLEWQLGLRVSTLARVLREPGLRSIVPPEGYCCNPGSLSEHLFLGPDGVSPVFIYFRVTWVYYGVIVGRRCVLSVFWVAVFLGKAPGYRRGWIMSLRTNIRYGGDHRLDHFRHGMYSYFYLVRRQRMGFRKHKAWTMGAD